MWLKCSDVLKPLVVVWGSQTYRTLYLKREMLVKEAVAVQLLGISWKIFWVLAQKVIGEQPRELHEIAADWIKAQKMWDCSYWSLTLLSVRSCIAAYTVHVQVDKSKCWANLQVFLLSSVNSALFEDTWNLWISVGVQLWLLLLEDK